MKNHPQFRDLLNSILVLKCCTPFGYKAFEFVRQKSYKTPLNGIFNFLVKETVFKHFCAGESLSSALDRATLLMNNGIYSILDWASEKDADEEMTAISIERNKNRIIQCLKAAQTINASVALKLSSIFPAEALECIDTLHWREENVHLHEIMQEAYKSNVNIYIDAEHSNFQQGIDAIALDCMKKYPGIIYNTYQMYRLGSLERLTTDYHKIASLNLPFKCKLVRGAYLQSERKDKIYSSARETHTNYDLGLKFMCRSLQNDIKSTCLVATHNKNSINLATELIEKYNLNERINFGQLLGMSNATTEMLVSKGFKVYKYLPYGPVSEVIPYLSRRVLENSPLFHQTIRAESSEDLKYFFSLLKDKLFCKSMKKKL